MLIAKNQLNHLAKTVRGCLRSNCLCSVGRQMKVKLEWRRFLWCIFSLRTVMSDNSAMFSWSVPVHEVRHKARVEDQIGADYPDSIAH